MAARALLHSRALAAAALGAVALMPATVMAEEPVAYKRKPIYDDLDALPAPPSRSVPQTETKQRDDGSSSVINATSSAAAGNNDVLAKKPRGPTPTDQLAVQIGKARLALYRGAVAAEDKVNETMDCAFNLEQSFTKTLASLAPARETGEKLMPGAIYVLVAAMAGSIVTRNRNVLLRATVPLAFGAAAGWAVLPVTMRNVSDLAWRYEQRFPAMADAHVQAREGIERGVRFAQVHARLGVRYVDDKVTDAREIVEGWVRQGK